MSMVLPKALDNVTVASRLDEVADLLEAQRASSDRVQGYRSAAVTLRQLPQPVHELLRGQGTAVLLGMGLGHALVHGIEQLVFQNYLPLLDRLRGGAAPTDPFAAVVGIGPELGRRIHETIGIDSLYELELAAHDGRLASVRGMGKARVQGVCEALAGRFRRGPDMVVVVRRRRSADVPPVADLLDVDREFLDRADELPRIAPKRFNPSQRVWLPVLHTERNGRHFTAMYCNTAHAHEPGAATDQVVIYRDDRGGDGQWTVVTSGVGAIKGRRIVRGREAECRACLLGEDLAGCAGEGPGSPAAGAEPCAQET
jgi:hypothetical protein